MKILAIGDIHCKIWIIDKVRSIIDSYDAIVFVGDYSDDWSASAIDTVSTWRQLMGLCEKYPYKVHALTGNHDYIYTGLVKASPSSGYNSITQAILSSSPDLIEWLRGLPVVIELDGVIYSHAGITKEWAADPTSLWNDDSPVWARPDASEYFGIKQVFGHTPQKTCVEIEPNIWCIDTFSTMPDGDPIGDGSVLEVINGDVFNVINL